AIACLASAETSSSAAAVDRMHDGVRTDYNKERRAQGVGNFSCGVFGASPMTGVIVRSSANVQAGAKTRMSTVLHGIWILGFVASSPWSSREVPMAALGAVSVVTGWKSVSLDHVRHSFHAHGSSPAAIWVVTFVLVVATDSSTGVSVGLAMSSLESVPYRRNLKLKVDESHDEHESHVASEGTATFSSSTKSTGASERSPANRP
ncbi:hypothetical protein OY671_009534, partial [Metschnikowia pulcherrima]